jgi:hypothetical protein
VTKIGFGPFGTVLKVREENNRYFAIKRIEFDPKNSIKMIRKYLNFKHILSIGFDKKKPG